VARRCSTACAWHSPAPCHADSEAPLSFSLAYAAPEVIAAYEAGATTMRASEACDVWSVGIVAFELLTGERVLGTAMTKAETLDALSGRTALPWEGAHAEAALKKLLRLRSAVLQCLSRDPRGRPSAAQLAAALDSIFRTVTEGGTMLQTGRHSHQL
jgi:serine/threonine protein kinase